MAHVRSNHQSFQTAGTQLINWDAPGYKLYEKAKKFGGWDPKSIDFSQDKVDFQKLNDAEREMICLLVSQFAAGEEAVTLDILPMIAAMSRQGRLEDTMYLTTFVYEEAKHTELFARWREEVGMLEDLTKYHNENYRKIFYEKLPEAMDRLYTDDSSAAIIRAATIYHMIVEGLLAESGYHSFRQAFESKGVCPGILKAVDYLNRDEGRHIGFGTYTIQRLITEDEKNYDVFMETMDELLPLALGVIQDTMPYAENEDGEKVFGIDWSMMIDYGLKQYQLREMTVSRAKKSTISDVEKEAIEMSEAN
ncbi:R2-like ligand-binding oxidase [Alkalihalobacterium elongatum]|uniref:R2-like ligand-binding oxidase n=1 Tax=Alkalihalobacterium elongatum TaxID=2675466 RepID=UPI001C1F5C25|nr:R2-like ligand-binding oxidase [Alkalihalobacterium elongatum]